ncbi:hypothetical protein CHU95_01050 [Niveispirillum lacus]|uniref:Pentapeptide repeat-containing protein n=1 Tax=Niveispirillum lacus TaxID=1981099 RepID=A0A255Z7G0_9PROT|nr:pentapeptide repeat-containing protein [Niveispirillum lacus]OYQ37483.1 hypothetical protein CHU95_01050 [Niveispirillum lacus]
MFVEATGFLLDLVFFGIFMALVLNGSERRQRVERYQEEIQDFKRWNSEEGRMRIAGAVRRLVGMGKTDIDFTGIKLTSFSFCNNDIKSIRGSRFYQGEWGNLSSREQVELDSVDFGFIDCSKVIFSPGNPLQGLLLPPPVTIKDCRFPDANLRGAVFNGALLAWTDPPPSSLYEVVDTDDAGEPSFAQSVLAPFDRADLTGASFRDVQFVNADFRHVTNILDADFSGAIGLDRVEFDDDETKQHVIRQSTRTSGQA